MVPALLLLDANRRVIVVRMEFFMRIFTDIVAGLLISIRPGPTSLYVEHCTLNDESRKGLPVSTGAVATDVFTVCSALSSYFLHSRLSCNSC